MNERCHLLSEIRKLAFVMQETVLFLDTHPCDAQALAYYHEKMKEKNRAVELYEEKYGPLTVNGNRSTSNWLWSTTPWPWEEE